MLENHSLINEFPQLKNEIHELKMGDAHFSRLFEQYHHIDKEIHRIESGAENTSDNYLEGLKKKRLATKDILYGLLRTYSA